MEFVNHKNENANVQNKGKSEIRRKEKNVVDANGHQSKVNGNENKFNDQSEAYFFANEPNIGEFWKF